MGTHARVLSTTLVHGNSTNKIRQRRKVRNKRRVGMHSSTADTKKSPAFSRSLLIEAVDKLPNKPNQDTPIIHPLTPRGHGILIQQN